jgi:hypothetical protein
MYSLLFDCILHRLEIHFNVDLKVISELLRETWQCGAKHTKSREDVLPPIVRCFSDRLYP